MVYVIDENADEPIMCIFSHIGLDSEDGQGVNGALFAEELLKLDGRGKKKIDIYINCPGGEVVDGMNIFNAILKTKTPVDTHNVGIAASMGGVIFMAGRKRIMSDYACLMIHNPQGGNNKAALDSFTDSLSTMLSAKSGITKEDVGYLMKKETWLNSAECFAKGFCTDIAITSEQNKKRMRVVMDDDIDDIQNPNPMGNDADDIQNPNPTGNKWRAVYKEATLITNNLFNKNTDMKKVTAKLKLNENSNEDAVVSAIETIENNAANAITALQNSETTLKTKVTGIEARVATLETARKKVTAALGLGDDATDAEIDTALDKVKTDAAASATAVKNALVTKATDKVNAAVKVGKIANKTETIAAWVKMATDDFDATEKIIDDLPLNKVANKIEVVNGGGDNVEALKSSGTAAGRMLAIENRLKK